MADIIGAIFKHKKLNLSKLEPFGFVKKDSKYIYEQILPDSGFRLIVMITDQGEVVAEVIDTAWKEPYTLHLGEGASGSFVGSIKLRYEEVLRNIAEKCFEPDVFKSQQAKEIIAYVRTAYDDELEFLWKKFPDNAIWRRQDTGKWYAALLTVSKRKLGFDSDEMAEVIDLRLQPEELELMVDKERYFPGYHMNKKHWYTIILDNSVPSEEIFHRIKISYELAVK